MGSEEESPRAPSFVPPEEPIRVDGSWVLAFDGNEPVLLPDACVVLSGGLIDYVGPVATAPPSGTVLGGPGRFVFPGFVNLHVHASSQAAERLFAEAGRPDLHNCGFLNYLPISAAAGEMSLAALEDPLVAGQLTLLNLISSGTTTLVEIGGELGGIDNLHRFVRYCGDLGVRAYLGPGYAAAAWRYNEADQLELVDQEKAGLAGLERAIEFAHDVDGAYDGRIRAMLFPLETATASPRLLHETADAAAALNVPVSIHVAETLVEWDVVTKRHGLSPVGYLRREGFLEIPHLVLGHALFLDSHSATTWFESEDLQRIAESGATVAHCPVVFARRGFALESFDRYRRAGVRMGIGTDAYPQDVLQEMRAGSLLAKVAERSFAAGHPRDLLYAATIGGADALGRPDLGRLAPGCAADVVVADFRRPSIGPVRDPVRALVHETTAAELEYVIVAGRVLKDRDGVRGIDTEALAAASRATAERIWEGFRGYRAASAYLDAGIELSFPLRRSLNDDTAGTPATGGTPR